VLESMISNISLLRQFGFRVWLLKGGA